MNRWHLVPSHFQVVFLMRESGTTWGLFKKWGRGPKGHMSLKYLLSLYTNFSSDQFNFVPFNRKE